MKSDVAQRFILDRFVDNFDIHNDILHDYDIHMDNILLMVQNVLSITRVSDAGYTHDVRLENLFWIRPYNTSSGTFNIDDACISGSLENELRADVIYEIKDNLGSIIKSTTSLRKLIFLIPTLNGSFKSSILSDINMNTKIEVLGLTLPVFNVNGTFKICLLEEAVLNNYTKLINTDGKVECRHSYFETGRIYRNNNTITYNLENIIHHNKTIKDTIVMDIPYEKPKLSVPIVYILLALECKVDSLFYDKSLLNHRVLKSIINDLKNITTEEAINYLMDVLPICKNKIINNNTNNSFANKKHCITNLLKHEYYANIFYDCDSGLNYVNKISYYFYTIISLILNPPKQIEDDCNIVISTPGNQLAVLVRRFMKKKILIRMIKKMLDPSKLHDADEILNHKLFNLTSCVRNGVWDPHSSVSDFNKNKTQNVIMGYGNSSISHQISKISRHTMRKNMNTNSFGINIKQFGRICMYCTPESEKCGVIHHKAVGSVISECMDLKVLMELVLSIINDHENIDRIGWVPYNLIVQVEDATVVLDAFGSLIGMVSNHKLLYDILVNSRRHTHIHPHVSFEYNSTNNTFRIQAENGRLLRPLIIVEQLHNIDNYAYLRHERCGRKGLVLAGLIEWISCVEEYSDFITVSHDVNCMEGYTHMDIHGALSMTELVCQPFMSFNQGVRRLQTGNMMSRSILMKHSPDYSTCKDNRLLYGQRSLITTPIHHYSHYNHPVSGYNTVVAIHAMDCNQEDAWVISKKFKEMGGLSTVCTEIVTVRTHKMSRIQKPCVKTLCRHTHERYHALLDSGLPKIGSKIRKGDAVVGQVMMKKNIMRCISKFFEAEGVYTITNVYCHPSVCKPHYIRVELESVHMIEVGDKFFFAHGQKGTCGKLMEHIDMPFISTGLMAGINPDIIINVSSMSRITCGLLIELLFGKALSFDSSCVNTHDTVFTSKVDINDRMEAISRVLRSKGMNGGGKEKMTDGQTGIQMEYGIYTGILNTHVLNHRSKDKLRYRERGPVNELTRQPTSGRRLFGGQKIGEMENWNIYAYGLSAMFRNLNFEVSDKFITYICSICKNNGIACKDRDFYLCFVCNNSESICSVNVPYITNLFIQELFTAGLGHRLII